MSSFDSVVHATVALLRMMGSDTGTGMNGGQALLQRRGDTTVCQAELSDLENKLIYGPCIGKGACVDIAHQGCLPSPSPMLRQTVGGVEPSRADADHLMNMF